MGLIQFVKSINWEQEAYPAYEDFVFLPLFALFFPSVRFFLDRFVFEKVGRRLIFGKGHQMLDTNTEERRKKIRKFKESAWKCIYYLSAEILALSVTYNEPWFKNTRYFWVGPGDQVWPDQKIKLKLRGLYMYAAGFYTYSIFALIFWETRRSDFGVSMGHHIATVILIVLSYIFRFGRVGSVVLAIHDASDVYLETGKMGKYSGAETIASFAFPIFVLSFVLLRLIYFPFWVLWSTSYEVLLTLDKEKHSVVGPVCYYLFNTLLFCLLVLHIYWGVLMYRMLVKQIQSRGKLTEDVRSEYCTILCSFILKMNMKIDLETRNTALTGLMKSQTDREVSLYVLLQMENAPVQHGVSAERFHLVARLLVGEDIVPERALILDSIQSQNFRGKLLPDETYAFKLETLAERKGLGGGDVASSLLNCLDYFPSGSMIDGLAAALLSRCELKNIKGTLCVSWPEFGSSVLALIRSLLQRNVLPSFDLSLKGEVQDQYARFIRIKHQPYDTELYT
ncbi:hypothetical protein CRYUN_Cryun04dG0189300 [Craigia yunnanensis]